jgi:hypothetical protein
VDSGTAPPGERERPTGRLIADVVRALRGWVVAIAGGVLLLGAYLGISKETDVSRQIPYLVSGGLGGLALVMIGAALLVSDKLEQTVGDGGRTRAARQVDDLHTLIVAAAGSGVGALAAPVTAGKAEAGAQAGPPLDRDALVAVPSGRSYHRATCELVAGKPAQPVKPDEIESRGLSACAVCQPPPAA